ncbi:MULTISPECIES: hypothetical protein [unclassified Spirosoma]|uniref:hypothetical protein n=1 Tax=unclassified Spirosoma TaxID=2621999 RepID=UPI0009594170|nr:MULTISPECIES: hypothetical protein [unclassified Spirosoma]MBN8823601.1 hypothetical protein [Spirosoma sp.]OJW76839.1 MAG: hypothetical protein BGO59_21660 [Spirosoma sp. 48-14]
MSVSSNSRKESTESYAAQAMHNTMGIPPALAQLNDKNLDNELPSRVADSNDTDVPGDVAEADALTAEADDDRTSAEIEESKRASWGQPPVSNDQNNPDWNSQATEQSVPATRANEPERTLGNA